jgi:predicted RNA methylase
MPKTSRQKIEFGDYQTPFPLAIQICETLTRLGVLPQTVVEPTCGIGAFVKASSTCFSCAKKIVAVDINAAHLSQVRRLACLDQRVEMIHADFFRMDWETVLRGLTTPILVIGNLPWVTNSALGVIEKEQTFQ